MTNNVYVLKDIAINKVLFLFTAVNELALNRIVDGSILSEGDNPFKHNIQDLQILQVGELDDETGTLINLPAPVFIYNVQSRVDDLEQRRIRAKAKEEAYRTVVEKLKAQIVDDPDFVKVVKEKEGITDVRS